MVAELAIPKPPDDPVHLLLDAQTGWRALRNGTGGIIGLSGVEESPRDGALSLSPKPVSSRQLTETAGTFGGLDLPTGVATDGTDCIYLLDAASGKLKRFDRCECRFEDVPCVGGTGNAPRLFQDAHGIAIYAGNLYICDTGNRRVQVFALKSMTLRGVWLSPVAAQLGQPWQPFDIAFDARGRALVTDRANGVVHRFHRGRWQTSFGSLTKPTHLTIDRFGKIYVVEQDKKEVSIFDNDGNFLKTESDSNKLKTDFCPAAISTDTTGNLYLAGWCVTDPDAKEGSPNSRLRNITTKVFDAHGKPVVFTVAEQEKLRHASVMFEEQGEYLSEPLDSGFYHCQWHRVVLEGSIPNGSTVKVETFTAETELDPDDIVSLLKSAWGTQQAAATLTTCDPWDCLITSPPGRYLYLRLTFKSNGNVTPRLTSVKLFFPRISLRRHLPAVFGQNPVSADSTDRMLAVFDTIFRSIESHLDNFARYLDPMSTPAERDRQTFTDFLSWLASWMGVILDRSWDVRKRRLFLRDAWLFHKLRGTLEGLRRQLLVYLGWTFQKKPTRCGCRGETPALILEHFKLRRWLFLGEARLGEQSVLWGKRIVNRTQLDETAQLGGTQLIGTPDPVRDPFHFYAHKFSVFIPAACVRGPDRRASVEHLISLAKPAHTVHQLELVEPRFRIGFQSAIGFDAVVGRYPTGFTLSQQRLGHDTVLAHSAEQKGPPNLQIGTQSRIGTTTILD